MSPKRQVHIVQKMAPGGIETFVLDLMRAADGSSITLSLEGSTDALLENWPALRDYPGAVIGLASKTGLKPSLTARISQHLRAFRPESVMLHHTGPLIYGGVAA